MQRAAAVEGPKDGECGGAGLVALLNNNNDGGDDDDDKQRECSCYRADCLCCQGRGAAVTATSIAATERRPKLARFVSFGQDSARTTGGDIDALTQRSQQQQHQQKRAPPKSMASVEARCVEGLSHRDDEASARDRRKRFNSKTGISLFEAVEESSSSPPACDDWLLAPLALTIARVQQSGGIFAPAMGALSANAHPLELVVAARSHKSARASSATSDGGRRSKETNLAFITETAVSFLFAGGGLVGAGVLLDEATRTWTLFQSLPEAVALVPVLFCLKGNLEMTLASRLSTMANLGLLATGRQVAAAAISNLTLIQTQAVVVSLLAAAITSFMQWIHNGLTPSWERVAALCLLSVGTATIASLVLGLFMLLIIVLCHRCHVNPDNVSTPLAASLGDVSTLLFMYLVGSCVLEVFHHESTHFLVPPLLLILFLLHGVWCALITLRDRFTVDVLIHGWWAILTSMALSSMGGFVFRLSTSHYPAIAAYQPVVNGVGGNLTGIQASRISTQLHTAMLKGGVGSSESTERLDNTVDLERDDTDQSARARSGKARTKERRDDEEEDAAARLLLMLALPGHLALVLLVGWITGASFSLDVVFVLLYLLVALLQVALLLWLARRLVRILWRLRVDPDHSAMPVLAAVGDVVGTVLLSTVFLVLSSLGRIPTRTDNSLAEIAADLHLFDHGLHLEHNTTPTSSML